MTAILSYTISGCPTTRWSPDSWNCSFPQDPQPNLYLWVQTWRIRRSGNAADQRPPLWRSLQGRRLQDSENRRQLLIKRTQYRQLACRKILNMASRALPPATNSLRKPMSFASGNWISRKHLSRVFAALVRPCRVELQSSEPESEILSIELWARLYLCAKLIKILKSSDWFPQCF